MSHIWRVALNRGVYGRTRLAAAIVTRETKAVLLPVLAVIDPSPYDLLNKVLWVGALDGLGIFCSSVSHAFRYACSTQSVPTNNKARPFAKGACLIIEA